ncbi:MAG: trigger factor [Bifidobacteriaceae bacterium]|nr:trigger factor [Bifidobacteriaceae bacterium]
MKSSIETLSPTKVKVTVDVSAEEFAPALRAAYRQAAQDIQVPGFRKGKVPPRILDQRLGKGVVVDFAIERSMDRWLEQAFAEHSLTPLELVEPLVTAKPDAADDAAGVAFEAELEVRPTLDLPDLTTLTVTVPRREVPDEDVDAEIEQLRERFGTLVGVDRPAAAGDFVSIDLTATCGDEEVDSVADLSYQVGLGNMIDGLDEALEGLSAGETTTFEAELAGGEHAGRTGLITVTAKSVKERELPDLDDDFAQLSSEFDTVAELREGVKQALWKVAGTAQYMRARRALPQVLADAVDMPVPEGVLASTVERLLSGQDDVTPERRAEVEAESATSIRLDLVTDMLAAALNVEVTQEDLVQFMLQAAAQVRMDPSEFVERAEETGAIRRYVIQVARGKAIDTALEQVAAVDDDGGPVDLAAILAEVATSDEDDADFADDEIADDE